MTTILGDSLIQKINKILHRIKCDLLEAYPDVGINMNMDIASMFDRIKNKKNEKFIFIIDEWDMELINLPVDDIKKYFRILIYLFKDQNFIELVYMTGVLPVVSYDGGSDMQFFSSFSIANDLLFYKYFGFTETEVSTLIQKLDSPLLLKDLERWYNGYDVNGVKIYNPFSITEALGYSKLGYYWDVGTYYDETLKRMSDEYSSFQNIIDPLINFSPIPSVYSKFKYGKGVDCVEYILSYLTIYGYLTYANNEFRIPNLELYKFYMDFLATYKLGSNLSVIIDKSNNMLKATLNNDSTTICEILEYFESLYSRSQERELESYFSCLLTLAYFSAVDHYIIVKEFPSGYGYADFAFIPISSSDEHKPFIIELKRDTISDDAIKQIKEKKYFTRLKFVSKEILLVGITCYNKKKKKDKDRFSVNFETIETPK